MVRPNPVKLEVDFNEAMHQIATASSERVQLQVIAHFLEEITGYETESESYILQLFQKLPDYSNPLLYAGIHPTPFKKFIAKIEEIIQLLELNLERDEIGLKLQSYKKALVHLFRWVGEHDESEILEDALALSDEKRSEDKFSIGVLVPVVEHSQRAKTGRLRRLKVEIIGESKSGFELKPTFGVVGSDSGSFLEEVEYASGRLLTESRNGKNKQWKATALFELSHAWHAGRSANLALAGAFYCEMLQVEEQSEYFKLNPAVCITGDIDKTGNVIPVDTESLHQKVGAAFFSWVHVLVVPVAQLSKTLQHVEELQTQFPNRYLPIVGVSHLQELFFDRRITLHKKVGILTHNFRRVWKRRFSVVSVSFIFLLVVIIGRLIYGPVDKNPVAIEYDGSSLIIKNSKGKILITKEVGDYMVLGANSSTSARYRYSQIIDIDGNGQNEFVWMHQRMIQKPDDRSIIYVGNVRGDTLWSKTIEKDFEYEYHPYINSSVMLVKRIIVEDIDSDGIEDIIIVSTHEQYFPSYLSVLDASNGKLKKEMLHQGYIEDVILFDSDQDGEKEVIYTGVNNTYKLGFLGVVKYSELKGQSGTSERYFLKDLEKTKESFYLIFPQTIIGRTLGRNRQIKTHGKDFVLEGSEKKIIIRVQELIDVIGANQSNFVNVQYTIGENLEVVSVAPIDDYDLKAKELYDDKVLNFLADGVYLESFKDSLLWWDGEEFVNYPTFANGYSDD